MIKKFLLTFLFFMLCSTVHAATYYIDYVGGSDSNNGISTSTPWQHVPGDINASSVPASKAVTGLTPGDTIIFKGGVAYLGTVKVNWSGSAGNPITYDGNSAGTFGSGQAIIDGQGSTLGASARQYGFQGYIYSGTGVSYITINNFEITDMRYVFADEAGINLGGVGIQLLGTGSNITIENNYLHDIQKKAVAVNTPIGRYALTVPYISSASITTNTFTDTAQNLSSYAGTSGNQAVYKIAAAFSPGLDYATAWGYVGATSGVANTVNVYQNIGLTTSGWNYSTSYNPFRATNVSGTAAVSMGGVSVDSIVSSVLTDTNADFNAAGAIADGTDYLHVISGSGVTPGDYLISNHTATSLTVAGNMGTSTAGSINYTIVRHYFYWLYNIQNGPWISDADNGGIGIDTDSHSNVLNHHNIVQDEKTAMRVSASYGGISNVQIYNNDISNTSWGITVGKNCTAGNDVTGLQIYNNKLHDFEPYVYYQWGYHNDGIFFFDSCSAPTTSIISPDIYNNTFYGAIKQATALIYLSYLSLIPTNVSIYNNIFAAGGIVLPIRTLSGNNTYPINGVNLYNNTFAQLPGPVNAGGILFQQTTNITMENNIYYSASTYGSIMSAPMYGSSAPTLISDYNFYDSALPAFQEADLSLGSNSYNLTQWVALKANDQHSIMYQNPMFNSFGSFGEVVAAQDNSNVISMASDNLATYVHNFQAGDYVYYNNDGIQRTITSVNTSAGTITISPGLSAVPSNSGSVSEIGDEVYDWGSNNLAGNYMLQSSSQAIKAGANLTSLCGSLPGLCSDIAGNPRPGSGSWDMGSYQFTGQSQSSGNGDASGNGKVTMYDAALVVQFLSGGSLSSIQQSAAEITGDNAPSTTDTVAIAKKAIGLP